MFLQNAKSEYANHFCDPVWLLKLPFLADLFDHLNILNKSFQGREESILGRPRIKSNDSLQKFACGQRLYKKYCLSLSFRRSSKKLQRTIRW
jgi:hypothetical protein